uniref:Putative radical SAM superfamily protein n=1 Tax=viral metagenome TaxID=1070528 RepID=A0A6M3K2F7_9ZZZZ
MLDLLIGTTTIEGKSQNTLGLEIITKELIKSGFKVVSVDRNNAREVDILLISLYWVDQVLLYPLWLVSAKIDPVKKKPIIIIGGSMTLNISPLEGMFHHAVIGDGEDVITNLIEKIKETNHDHVLSSDDIKRKVTANVATTLPMEHYIELRTNKITRIEIARGCKMKCSFCQLTHIKPYREIPPIILKNLIATSPTKNIALFAPDRGSYSGYQEIEKWCNKYGKRNMGTDIRLKTLREFTVATNVRFGIEGFSERERKYLGKPYTNKALISDVMHVLDDIKTPKGKPITVLTWYMIIGLPGQSESDYQEFVDLLWSINDRCKNLNRKITIFLTHNDFLPMNHTPMENESKDIWIDHIKNWNKLKPKLPNITIAQHGGSRSPAIRLAQLLVSRGGEGSSKALFNLSLKHKNLLKGGVDNGKKLLILMKNCGVDTESLIHGYKGDFPWSNIKIGGLANA